jgi:hypothetical protein
MTTLIPFVAGNIVAQTVTFVPETGTVALADVTAKLRKADGVEVVLTGITTTATNTFRVGWASAENDPAGIYRIRWESNTPSPRIVVEDRTSSFILLATAFATP